MGSFASRFKFDPQKHLFVGVERECFLTRKGKIVPIAAEIISKLNGSSSGSYGYELSACQLETRTSPTRIEEIGRVLADSHRLLNEHEKTLGFEALHQEVAPYKMPLDVYPDPTGRYQVITKKMPIKVLRAACRVAGTHIHIGMASPEQAVAAYNVAIEHLNELCKMGNKSKGERLQIYKIMAPDFKPPHYDSWECYERYAKNHGFDETPRNCWHLIRISIHGTIEFRVFGATPRVDEIVEWTNLCHSICRDAL